jgi:FtsH-binding integral membrane protein
LEREREGNARACAARRGVAQLLLFWASLTQYHFPLLYIHIQVFGLLSAQLLLTALIAAPMVLVPSVGQWIRGPGAWLVGVSAVAAFALVLVLTFSESARHSHPTNLLLLAAFTALEGIGVGAIAAGYTLTSVAVAVAMTAGVAGALAAYAARTKTDYTPAGGALCGALTALLLTGLMFSFSAAPAAELVLAGIGSALFGLYLVFDVQLLLGGGGRFALSPDDYVAGAISLYLDLVNLFLHLLRLFGTERD